MPDYLSPSSLDWALAHIRKFGDTDIFPVPFEIKPIADRWQEIRKHLEQVNLSTYSVQAAQRILMPKSRVGFRVATQLDPIDSIVYAAIIYEAAPAIEKYRVPKRLKTVFSYRIKPQSDGSLFAIDEYGWQGYHERSSKLAHSSKTNFVLTADIADFYNHIYHHRVNNFLQSAGVPIERTKNIESFLSQLSAKHSRGVPVGPFPSIALAEATLDDVDKFLLSRGITYVRYVDDFRIFTKHKSDAILASHDLTEYLYTAHRLALASAKTGLYAVKTFIEKELVDPREEEERGKVTKLKELIKEIWSITGYHVDFEELPESDLNKVTRQNLVDLFNIAIEKRPLHLGLLRYVLRRAKQLKTAVLRDPVLDNLDQLAPAMREVIDYLVSSVKNDTEKDVAKKLIEHVKASPSGTLPFVVMWILDFFVRRPVPGMYAKCVHIAETSREQLGIRPLALLSRSYKQVQWVRSQKERWSNHSPWDRRAVIWAASILPDDERKHWCGLVKDTSTDPLDQAVAISARLASDT